MAPMKVQPIAIDIDSEQVKDAVVIRNESVLKSRLKRLFIFDRQLPKISKDVATEFEPSSVCLAKMVQNFMEEQPPAPKCGRNRCNCFNANSSDEDDFDLFGSPPPPESSNADAAESLKVDNQSKFYSNFILILLIVSLIYDNFGCDKQTLIPCASVGERNLLADVARIVEKNGKSLKRKDDLRKVVAEALSSSLGYDSSICKSKWEKTSSCPAGTVNLL